MHEQTLRLRTAKLGPDHPRTLVSRQSLAVAYRTAGRTTEAIAIWEAMLPAARTSLGPGHPNTLTFTNSLATTYESLERWGGSWNAAALRARRRRERQIIIVMTGPAIAADLVALGSNLLQQREWTEAERVLRESLKIGEAKRPDDWSTFAARSLLGASLMGQQRYAEAEPLVVVGYDGLRAREAKLSAKSKRHLPEAAERVVKLYEAWGKKEKVTEWRNKLGLKTELPANPFQP